MFAERPAASTRCPVVALDVISLRALVVVVVHVLRVRFRGVPRASFHVGVLQCEVPSKAVGLQRHL